MYYDNHIITATPFFELPRPTADLALEGQIETTAPKAAPYIGPRFTAYAIRERTRSTWEHYKSSTRSKHYRMLQLTMAENQGPDMTAIEIYKEATRRHGYPYRTNGSRVSALMRGDGVVVTGERICGFSGKIAATYELTGRAFDRKKFNESAYAPNLIYMIRRGAAIVRIASHVLAPGTGETLRVFKADRRISTKLPNGDSAIPSTMPLFDVEMEPVQVATPAQAQ